MNNRRTRNIAKILITQVLIAVAILAIGFCILFYAQGYRYNLKTLKVIKTGLIYVVADQKEADIYINNKLVSAKTPFGQVLTPGKYSVRVEKDGFMPWHTGAEIKPELVTDFRHVVLFKDDIETTKLTDERKVALLTAPIDVLAVNAEQELSHNDYEIWISDTLVTRFSKPISRAVWYPDLWHIIYQQGNEIRVIEKNGQNDTLLVTLKDSSLSAFTIGEKGNELYYTDNGEYRMAIIK